jgi:hypothetical protein
MKSKAIRKSKNKVTKKDKIKGWIFIIFGIIGLIIYVGVSVKDIKLGGGFFVILLSLVFILEGSRLRKGKKSILFTPSFNP